jgi:hypothetical protein
MVKERKENITILEVELAELGTHIYGNDNLLHGFSPAPAKRKPATAQLGGPALKRARSNSRDAAIAAAAAKKKKMDIARAKERQRLNDMKDQLAEMIRQYKELAKAKEEEQKPPEPEVPPPKVEDMFNVLKNQDKILLESDENVEKKNVDAVNIEEFRVRRISLLNLNRSFKPDLEPDTKAVKMDSKPAQSLNELETKANLGLAVEGDAVPRRPGSGEGRRSRSRTATPESTGAKTLQVKLPSKQKRMKLENLIVSVILPYEVIKMSPNLEPMHNQCNHIIEMINCSFRKIYSLHFNIF